MTGRNLPAGWAAFQALRQRPAPIRPRLHGNWRHGMRSKRGREDAALVRLLVRVLRRPSLAPDWLLETAPRPMGWRGYLAGRNP